jgi:hypothetical protein
MDQKKFEEYLTDRYESRLKYYEKRRRKFHNAFRALQVTLIMTSATAPVVTAFAEIPTMKYIGVCLSAIVAILTSLQRTLRFEDAWINARMAREDLWRERYSYLTGISEYSRVQDKESLFAQRVEAIIASRENAQEERLRASFKDMSDQIQKPSRGRANPDVLKLKETDPP